MPVMRHKKQHPDTGSGISIQDVPHMAGFEKHILLNYDYDRGDYEDDDCLYTLGLGSHGDLLLHEVDEQVEYDACKDRAVACKIHPGDDKA